MGRLDEATVRFLGPPRLDAAVARLARAQHGVVALKQLVALGLSARVVQQWAARGRLHRLYRGVYAVGHTALSREGRWLAAVLACGPEAVLSHRSAAALWEIRPTSRTRIDVTVPRSSKGPATLDVHRTRGFGPGEVRVERGIRVTSVARTLADLADVLPLDALARAIHEAEVRRLLDVKAIDANGRRGAANLRAALATPAPSTRSELETRFAALCRREGLPLPRLDAHIALPDGLVEVDALWPHHRVIAELDGAAVHHTRRAFERDRAKGLMLAAEGYVVVRITWRQLTEQPHVVAERLCRLLATR